MRLTRKDELKVGILFILLIITVFVLLFVFGNIQIGAKEGKEYILNFSFLDGLKEGASVRFSGGILCGKVTDIYPNEKYAAVKIWVDNSIPVTEYSRFSISTTGLIGEKYIIIKQSKTGGEKLKDGTIIAQKNTINPMNMDEALLKVNNIVADLSIMSESIREYVEGGGKEDIGEAINNVTSLVATLNSIMERNKENFDVTLSQLSEVMANVNHITEKADKVMDVVITMSESFTGEEFSELIHNVNFMVGSVTDLVESVTLVVDETKNSLAAFLVRIDDFVRTTQILISDIGPEISTVLTNVDSTFQGVGEEIKLLAEKANTAIGKLSGEMSVALSTLNDTAIKLSGRVGTTLDVFEEEAKGLITDLRRAVRTVDTSVTGITRELTALTSTSSDKIINTLDYIEKIAGGIKDSTDVFDAESLQHILDSITAVAEELKNITVDSGDRIEDIFDKVDKISNDVETIIADAKEGLSPTLKAIRNLSATLENLSQVGEEKLIVFFDTIEKLSENLDFLSEDGENRIKEMFENVDTLLVNLEEISTGIKPGLVDFLEEDGGLKDVVTKLNEIIVSVQDVVINVQTDLAATLGNIDDAAIDISSFFKLADEIEPLITTISETIESLSDISNEESLDLSGIMNMLVQVRDIVETLRYIVDELAPVLSGAEGEA